MVKRTTLIEIITVLNIILFLYTGIAKIQDYDVFIEQLGENPILAHFATAIAILLPIVEFLIVLLLIVPRWRYKGLLVTLALMILFTGYIIALFSFSTEMPCSCGGIIELLSWKGHLMFNGAFILLNIWAIILSKRQKKASQIHGMQQMNMGYLTDKIVKKSLDNRLFNFNFHNSRYG